MFSFILSRIISIRPLIIGLMLMLPLQATALTPLDKEQHINHSLISAGIADEIRKNCSTVNARMLRALRKAKALEQYARDQGYAEGDVRAFLDSPVERKRVKSTIDSYLAENGVVHGNEATYCSLGRAEIAKGSLIGQLLWTW
ncbi:MAG: DUF5333 domain-containing protein [Paracoccaceae bacterium]